MEADEWSIGQRIASHRARRGLTQEELAGLVGISLSMMKKIESGQRAVTRFSQLVQFGRVLRIKDLRELTGVPFAVMPDGRPNHPAVAGVHAAMMDRQPHGDLPDLDDLDEAIERAWGSWQEASAFRYDLVGQQLPGLIRNVQVGLRGADGQEHRRTLRLASKLYQLTRTWTKRVDEHELSMVAADRAVTCALDADDPDLTAAASWNLAMILSARGKTEHAMGVVRSAIENLEPHMEQPDQARLAVFGGLHLLGATEAARADQAGDARRLLDTADRAARVTGETNHFRMVFGPTNVAVHRVSTAVELGRTADALALAERVDIQATQAAERRITFHMDSARCHLRQKNDVGAVHMIQRIYRDSPEELRYNSSLRELLRTLKARPKPVLRGDLQPLLAAADLLN